jgi:hypothetical protein
MTIYTSLWGVLALTLVMLAVYRKVKARSEDDTIHLSGSSNVVKQQQVTAHSIDVLDRWGIILTIITAVYGLTLLGVYLYNIWEQGKSITY